MGWLMLIAYLVIGFLIGHDYGIGAGVWSVMVLIFLGGIADELVEINERHGCKNTTYDYDFKP